MSRQSWLAVSLILLAWPRVATAQTCFRGHPGPRCSGFTVLEFTGGTRLNSKAWHTDQSEAFAYWSFGYLRNMTAHSALGAGIKLTADSDGSRLALVGRYRRWLSSRTSIDVAPGLYVSGKDNFVTVRFPSPTADVALNIGDWVGLAIGVDGLRAAGFGTQWQSHAGARFGTWLAPLATVGLGILIAATWN